MRLEPVDHSRSHAVLIGVATYDDPDIPDVPAALNSLTGMYAMLTDPERGGWPADRVTSFPDPGHAGELAVELRRLARETTDVLLLYYVGHAQPGGSRSELCLMVTRSRADAPAFTGLPFSWVDEALRESPARVKAVILDCCYAGRAIEGHLGSEGRDDIADVTDIAGTYTLTATSRNGRARVPDTTVEGGLCTSFTSELLDLIRTGIPGAKPELTLGVLYPHLRSRLLKRKLPQPNQRGTDTVDRFPFTRNTAPPAPASLPEPATAAARWWRRRGVRPALGAVATMALIGSALVYADHSLTEHVPPCAGNSLSQIGSDHVGVTDGSYAFSADLKPVSALIEAENRAAACASPEAAPWVSVVFLMPLTSSAKDAATAIRHEVEGAYVAQHDADSGAGKHDAPRIRLLLANAGVGAAQNAYALRQIEARRASDRIVAVAGLGYYPGSENLVRQLTHKDGIPVVSATPGGSLTQTPGLVQVGLSATQLVSAYTAYTRVPASQKVRLIGDRNPSDLYTDSLNHAVSAAYGSSAYLAAFDSSQDGEQAQFATTMTNLCASEATSVIFTGRAADLALFLHAVTRRVCADRPIAVLTTESDPTTGSAPGRQLLSELEVGKVRLLLAGPAQPAAAPKAAGGTATARFQPGGTFRAAFPAEDLDDGRAVLGHDTVFTAVTAIDAAGRQHVGDDIVGPQEVILALSGKAGVQSVAGAGGTIRLSSHGMSGAETVDLYELTNSGTLRILLHSGP